MKKFIILMGLPGSGKTTYAENMKKSFGDLINVIFCDEKDINREIRMHLSLCMTNIIDGLFLTNDDIVRVLQICYLYMRCPVEIHYWKPDRKKCLYNDQGRREKSSELVIQNAKIEEPDINRIKLETGYADIFVVYHDIVEKPDWKVKADQHQVKADGPYLYSEFWSLGGCYGNCWNDLFYYSDAYEEPDDFTAFDELIEKVKPDMNFREYKKIFKECVKVETQTSQEYYGGYSKSARYRCDLIKLFQMLEEVS